jgi:hypothetical protein
MVSAILKIGKTNLPEMHNWPDRIAKPSKPWRFARPVRIFGIIDWHPYSTKAPPMIDRKYQKIVFAFFMALLMSCVMSFVITLFNVGLISNLVSVWLKAWAFAFVVAFPTISVVAPIVQKLVGMVLKDES